MLPPTCTTSGFFPYLNPTSTVPSLELAFLLAFFVHLYISVKTKTLLTCLSFILFSLAIEWVGWMIQSHVHAQFFLQLTCYLPLKEAVYYVNTMFASSAVASRAGLDSHGATAALAAALTILQDAGYEMTNAREGVKAVWVNVGEDYKFGVLKESVNHGSVAIMVSFLLLGFVTAFATLKCKEDGLALLVVPVVGMVGTVLVHWPYQVVKYLGCSHLDTSDFGKFHFECMKSSSVSDSTCLFMISTIFGYIIINAFSHKGNTAASKISEAIPKFANLNEINPLAFYVSPILCHGVFLHMLFMSTTPARELVNDALIILTLAFGHLLLTFLALNSSSAGKNDGELLKTLVVPISSSEKLMARTLAIEAAAAMQARKTKAEHSSGRSPSPAPKKKNM